MEATGIEKPADSSEQSAGVVVLRVLMLPVTLLMLVFLLVLLAIWFVLAILVAAVSYVVSVFLAAISTISSIVIAALGLLIVCAGKLIGMGFGYKSSLSTEFRTRDGHVFESANVDSGIVFRHTTEPNLLPSAAPSIPASTA